MPYSVEHLIQNPTNVISVQINDTIIQALDLMIKHNFSQLPVLDNKGCLLGMVTYESIIRATRTFNVKLDNISVRDAKIKAPHHYQDDSLFDLLDDLKNTNAVVIIDLDGHPTGIVTSYDTTDFLRDHTEDMMRVEDIEITIKEFIRLAYQNKKGEVDEDKLNLAIEGLYVPKNGQMDKKPRTFDELTLNDYIILFTDRFAWDFLNPILKIKREALIELLQKIRKTRNDLAHFRGNISSRDRGDLRYCADWLTGRYQDYKDENEKAFIKELLKPIPETKLQENLIQEEKQEYIIQSGLSPKEGNTKYRSRYSALANWLEQQKDNQINLTFATIEGIIGSSLPDSARVYKAWWANDTVGHTHSILWLNAGWRVDSVYLSENWVRFIRYK